ncbi:hypothetical protein Y1Q_0004645 [Alligator mississippiensis]|uniref:Uncharacterized protein n=1 Tax=Alligator mississippiensis TaxID=8496 RepID=A0A151MHT6_ALLMI|nr:hypothetical protein Y1Q_0004645 [Alligator mississippiensis]
MGKPKDAKILQHLITIISPDLLLKEDPEHYQLELEKENYHSQHAAGERGRKWGGDGIEHEEMAWHRE